MQPVFGVCCSDQDGTPARKRATWSRERRFKRPERRSKLYAPRPSACMLLVSRFHKPVNSIQIIAELSVIAGGESGIDQSKQRADTHLPKRVRPAVQSAFAVGQT